MPPTSDGITWCGPHPPQTPSDATAGSKKTPSLLWLILSHNCHRWNTLSVEVLFGGPHIDGQGRGGMMHVHCNKWATCSNSMLWGKKIWPQFKSFKVRTHFMLIHLTTSWQPFYYVCEKPECYNIDMAMCKFSLHICPKHTLFGGWGCNLL